MHGFHIRWLLFLVHSNEITCSISTFVFKQKPVKVNDILELRPYFPEKDSRSPIECSRSCSRVDGCISIIFDKNSQECRIFSSDIAERKRSETGTRDVDKTTHWVYYHIVKECSPDETFCPEEYSFTPELCFCFKYFSEKRTPELATLYCKATSAGDSRNANGKADLAKIDSPAKQERIESYLRSKNVSSPDNYVVIQGTKSGDEWIDSDEAPLRYTNWGEGEKDKTREHNLYIALSVTNFSWYSKDNESEFPYLCEISPPEYLIVP